MNSVMAFLTSRLSISNNHRILRTRSIDNRKGTNN
uniref:Uncharacterized protein n=1 Tax=Arundo donax TaxID=35708 RepID=A0A0A9H3N0_ARUDO